MNDHAENRPDSGASDPKNAAFWKRYEQLLEEAGVLERGRFWFGKECERFIAWLEPIRLGEAQLEDLTRYLAYLESTGLERWKQEQAHEALRILSQKLLGLPWAKNWPTLAWPEVLAGSESIQKGLDLFWSGQGQKSVFDRVRERYREPIDKVVTALRLKHYSYRTEETYLSWVYRFLIGIDPAGGGALDGGTVRAFLEHLAVEAKVSASTQNQALNALVFFFREGLGQELEELGSFERAKRSKRLPVVLTASEVRRVLERMEGTYRLMAKLLYGSGLRLMECVRLRVKDIDFGTYQIIVRSGTRDNYGKLSIMKRIGSCHWPTRSSSRCETILRGFVRLIELSRSCRVRPA